MSRALRRGKFVVSNPARESRIYYDRLLPHLTKEVERSGVKGLGWSQSRSFFLHTVLLVAVSGHSNQLKVEIKGFKPATFWN